MSVQLLRGLAAFVVMCFHFRWNINLHHPGVGGKLFGWGAIGVDFFFIISGFVIVLTARNLEPGFPSVIKFIRHRCQRILPVYYVILFISFLLCGAMSTFHYEDKTQNLISALLFMPVWPDHTPFYVNDSGFFGVRWTLNYELMFYALMSLSLFTKYRWYALAAGFCILQLLVPLLSGQQPSMSLNGYSFENIYLQLATNPLMLTFLPGVLIGIGYGYLNRINVKVKWGLLFFSLLLSVYMIFIERNTAHGVCGSGWYLSLLFLSCVINEELIAKITPSFFVSLGDASFSLYLIHGLMNDGIGKRFSDLGIQDGMPRFFASVLVSVFLAFLSYRYVEKGLASLFKKY